MMDWGHPVIEQSWLPFPLHSLNVVLTIVNLKVSPQAYCNGIYRHLYYVSVIYLMSIKITFTFTMFKNLEVK